MYFNIQKETLIEAYSHGPVGETCSHSENKEYLVTAVEWEMEQVMSYEVKRGGLERVRVTFRLGTLGQE